MQAKACKCAPVRQRNNKQKMSTQPFGTCLCEQRDSIQSQNTAPSYLVTFYVCVRNDVHETKSARHKNTYYSVCFITTKRNKATECTLFTI